MNERQACAMAMLFRGTNAPYDSKAAAVVWRVRQAIAARWLKELMREAQVLELVTGVSRRWKIQFYRPSQFWYDAVQDARDRREEIGICPGCGKQGMNLIRWCRPPSPLHPEPTWGYWCGDCMTKEEHETDCPRCYATMSLRNVASQEETAVGLVYLRADCVRCKLRIESAGKGLREALRDLETVKARRAWEWLTWGPRARREGQIGDQDELLQAHA